MKIKKMPPLLLCFISTAQFSLHFFRSFSVHTQPHSYAKHNCMILYSAFLP